MLNNLLERISGRENGGALLKRMTDGWRDLSKKKEKLLNNKTERGVNPYKIANLIGKYVNKGRKDGFVISVDTGLVTDIFLSSCMLDGKSRVLLSHYMWSMGCSIPYAVGAYNALSNATPVSLVGDGGLLMSLGELATLKRSGAPAKIIVFNNSELALVKHEQRSQGYREFGIELGEYDFAKIAEAFGIKGVRIDNETELVKRFDEVFTLDYPVLVDVRIDKESPPLIW